jgi:hypothetical protein
MVIFRVLCCVYVLSFISAKLLACLKERLQLQGASARQALTHEENAIVGDDYDDVFHSSLPPPFTISQWHRLN